MKLIPFKNRSISTNLPVRVYRNLHSKDESHKYSVMQNRLVIGHTNDLWLKNCKLIVSEALRNKVIKEKKKNVHAFIEGFVFSGIKKPNTKVKIEYNPYLQSKFSISGIYEEYANFVHISDCVWSVN